MQSRVKLISYFATFIVFAAASGASAAPGAQPVAIARNTNISLEFDDATRTRVVAELKGKQQPLGPFTASETVVVDGRRIEQFTVRDHNESSISDARGQGKRLTVRAAAGTLEKEETVDSFPSFPSMLFVNVRYRNAGSRAIQVEGWRNQAHTIQAGETKGGAAFWSLESGSYEPRPDWVVPLKAGFNQQNYLGMNADDYGGGTPVIDVWRPDVGIAVGHDEPVPELVSEPVAMPSSDHATVAVEYQRKQTLAQGQSFKTFETFVAVHTGDYFNVLRDYRRLMIAKGMRFENPSAEALGPIWCAWGFGRGFQPRQIENALPEAKKLGFRWTTMDDGWQTNTGDWQPDPKKFPRGDADIRALVDKIHQSGMKAQLWWAPLAAVPDSDVFRNHPDWLLLDAHGSKRKISWWNAFYLCPADPAVVRYHQQLTEKIFKVWGFDGLKLDGQFLNAVPQCTNPAHHHQSQLDSVQQLPLFFKAISDAAHSVNPGALIELCPCGTSYSFFSMPYYNMTVASDPGSSWQVRSKGKTLKALMGDTLPYFGDHVELSDGGADFASTVGVGGVIGTQYRWPPDDKNAPRGELATAKLVLTPAKEQTWAKWVNIYKQNLLSAGEYQGGLYDIGFDKPEAHCIKKDDALYYAFFAPEWKGKVSLRGLAGKRYRVTDYVNGQELGVVDGPAASLNVNFKHSLLIVAREAR